jgi:hypothetical protein
MTDIEFRFPDADRFAAACARVPQVAQRELVASTNRLTLLGEREAKQGAPVKSGNLRRAITATPATFGGGTVTGRWGVSVQSRTGFPYHITAERGRRGFSAAPGKVLVFEIGGRTIYTKRVRAAAGRWYMRGSLNAVRPRVGPEYRGALSRIIAAISGGG